MVNVGISPRQRGSTIKLVSWNVKSLNHPVKRKKVFAHLEGFGADVAFLQETHLHISYHGRLKDRWVVQTHRTNFNSKARGCAIIIIKMYRL